MSFNGIPSKETIEMAEEWRELQDRIAKEKIHHQEPSLEKSRIISRSKELYSLLKKAGYFR